MPVSAPSRYWHTLRHLRPVQFYGRLWFRLAHARPNLSPAPATRKREHPWWACKRPSRMVARDTFRFLGVARSMTTPNDWNHADWSKLWLYNAHYFDDLTASDAASRTAWHRAIVGRWIAENPPAQGIGWEPYPASLRIVNWIKWAWSGKILDSVATQSLAVQARFLHKRLEHHLLGNHLWANVKALIFVGTYFEGREADSWRRRGLALFERELAEQVLGDGGHFERSPMYQGILLEDLLDLVQLAQSHPALFESRAVASWQGAASRMLHWLRVMSHPDDGIAFFNDAAFGIAPDYSALRAYAKALGLSVDESPLGDIEPLQDSGYVRFQRGGAVLIADVAQVGPDYLPGHAHADTLSFELSLEGQRVLVNGGTSTYEAGAERQRERGTAMHNTVLVDDADSSEVWASFRVARRARPFDVAWGEAGEGLWLKAAHDGYLRLPGKVVHRRRWALDDQGLVVGDALEGRYVRAEARFRFAPGVTAECDGQSGRIRSGNRELRWSQEYAGQARIEAGMWHPRFGASEPCRVLVLPFAGPRLITRFAWS